MRSRGPSPRESVRRPLTARRLSGPALEGAVKRAALRIAQTERHLRDRDALLVQVRAREMQPHLIEQLAECRAMAAENAGERLRVQAEASGYPANARAPFSELT